MSVETAVEIIVDVDIEKELVCELVSDSCPNKAEWLAIKLCSCRLRLCICTPCVKRHKDWENSIIANNEKPHCFRCKEIAFMKFIKI